MVSPKTYPRQSMSASNIISEGITKLDKIGKDAKLVNVE